MFDFTLGLLSIQSLVLGLPRSVGYGWVPSHEVGLHSNHILVAYSHKFCATIDLAYPIGRRDCGAKLLWLSQCNIFLFVPSEHLPTTKTIELWVRVPCRCQLNFSMFNEFSAVFLDNRVQLWVCWEWAIVLATDYDVWDFHGTTLTNNSIKWT